MKAIMKREFTAYFHSPVGYVYLAVFTFLSGLFFLYGTLQRNTADLSTVFSQLLLVIVFLIPLLTMRLMSEDARFKTDQALLTAPVPLTGIVLGKYFAAGLVYALGLSVTLLYGLVISMFAAPNWAILFCNFLALLLLGLGFIAIGQFISSLTENQIVAGIGTIVLLFSLYLLDSVFAAAQMPVVGGALRALAVFTRYDSFSSGILDASNLLFFLSLSAVFLFLTVRVLEKKRWS